MKSFRLMEDTGIHSLGCFMLIIIGIGLVLVISFLVHMAR